MKTFGEALKETRQAKRYTLKHVAELLNKSIGYIADLEHNRRRPPSLDEVEKLETFFEVPRGQLGKIAEYYRGIAPSEIVKKINNAPQLSALLMRAEEAANDGKDYDEILKVCDEALNNLNAKDE